MPPFSGSVLESICQYCGSISKATVQTKTKAERAAAEAKPKADAAAKAAAVWQQQGRQKQGKLRQRRPLAAVSIKVS